MIGNRIKLLREEFGLKQDELAKALNVSPSSIGMYERDEREPNDDITLKLSNFFGVSTDFLLGKSDVRNPEKPINDEDVKIVADSGILGLNDYNRQVAIDIIKGLKAKQDIDEKNKKD